MVLAKLPQGRDKLGFKTMKFRLYIVCLAFLIATAGCQSTPLKLTPGSALLKEKLRNAEMGDASAQYDVGKYYAVGRDGDRDRVEAVAWFRKAAEQKHAKAQTALGISYLRGQGVPMDWPEAVTWFEKSAAQGDADAQAILLALAWFEVPVVTNSAGAGENLRAMAIQGNAMAQLALGMHCLRGAGATNNQAEATRWFRKAAVQDLPLAQACLGSAYFQGLGVPTNYFQAVKWSRKAAEAGEAVAQEILGRCCQKGKGVRKDEQAAVYWFRKAAEQGDGAGQMYLGLAYFQGSGVPRDFAQAYKWLDLAASQGVTKAISAREDVSRLMSAAQLAQAGVAARLHLTKFDRQIIDAHEQRYDMSCIPSSVEMVLKLMARVPASYYEQQTAWKNKADGSFHNFDGKTIAGCTFHQQFTQAHGGQFPLIALFEAIDRELKAGRFVIIGLPVAGGTHDWVIYDEDAAGEFLSVSKAGPRTIENNHVKRTVTDMQGTDIGSYEIGTSEMQP